MTGIDDPYEAPERPELVLMPADGPARLAGGRGPGAVAGAAGSAQRGVTVSASRQHHQASTDR